MEWFLYWSQIIIPIETFSLSLKTLILLSKLDFDIIIRVIYFSYIS